MKTTELMDKQIMELSASQIQDHSFRFLEADTDYGIPSSSCLDKIGSTNTTNKINNMSMVAEVDRIMKEHSSKLLHGIEDLSGRLSHMESKMHYLENSMNDLKVSLEYYNNKTDGKLRQLENIIREVQNGVHLLKDTQQIAETQSQHTEVQAPSTPQTEDQNVKVPKRSEQTILSTDTPLLHDMPNVSYQNQCPPSQGSVDWLSYNPHSPSCNPPLPQTLGAYQVKPPPILPHQNYQTPPQLSQMHFMPDTSTVQSHFPPKNRYEEERPYMPHSYNPTITQSPFKYPGAQFAQHPYTDFTHPSEFSDRTNKPFNNGSSSPYSPSTMKTSEFSYSPWENESTQLPIAKFLLPHALPTASFVATTEPSTAPDDDDDIVEKATSMGFRRDLVKVIVKKLADNGQSVDLNEVIDKLMNN